MDKKETFIAAIKTNENTIFKIAAVYTNNIEDKNDLIQEIIYQLWKSYDSFDHRSVINTWIYRVALNVAIYHLKITKKRVVTIPIEEQVLNVHDTAHDYVEEKWQLLRQKLNNLNLLDRGIIMLYLDNKSYEEIADIIGISATNIGTKLSRIKEKLRSQIAKQ